MPNVHSPSPDSVEAGAPANEIEITPEMIEAGVNALWATCAIEHPCGADRGIIPKIFTAMIQASSLTLKEKRGRRESY
jgi:hypothetical protein